MQPQFIMRVRLQLGGHRPCSHCEQAQCATLQAGRHHRPAVRKGERLNARPRRDAAQLTPSLCIEEDYLAVVVVVGSQGNEPAILREAECIDSVQPAATSIGRRLIVSCGGGQFSAVASARVQKI